jgi:cell division septum initiation protein DivIVA
VRAFVQLRELLSSNKELAKRLDQLEARIEKKLTSHDDTIATMLSASRNFMNPPAPKRRGIGFTADISEPKQVASGARQRAASDPPPGR